MNKTITLFCLFATLLVFCEGFSQPVIRNTKAEGCVDGVCGEICKHEDIEILKGETLNQLGKCRKLRCGDDFTIFITPCPFDMTGMSEWVNPDESKLYPECCGTRVQKKF